MADIVYLSDSDPETEPFSRVVTSHSVESETAISSSNSAITVLSNTRKSELQRGPSLHKYSCEEGSSSSTGAATTYNVASSTSHELSRLRTEIVSSSSDAAFGLSSLSSHVPEATEAEKDYPPKDNADKRKKRTREEIYIDKIEAERQRNEKKRIREEAKESKEREKAEKRIHRELSAAQKSKAEQYMFCHVGKGVFDLIGGLELHARMVFMERNIENQLKCDNNLEMRIEWHRKCMEAVPSENGLTKFEYMSAQHVFAFVLSGSTLRELAVSDSLEDFVITQKALYPVANSHMILVSYGEHKIPPKKLMDITLSLFESCRTQLRVVLSVQELSLFMAQMLRGLTKAVRSDAAGGGDKLIIDVDKGVRDGDTAVLVHDWWDKMLGAVCRMGDAQRRAILKHIPDPLRARTKFAQMDYATSVKELSEIVCENGRRVGPAMAHRLYMILLDPTGAQIVE